MMISGLGAATAVTPGIATIASTIQTVEGYYPGSLAYQNNNPGNVIYTGQAGATQGPAMTGTPYYFAKFDTYQDGYNALVNTINSYANSGVSLDDMMGKYAPAKNADGTPTGNNPTAYAQQIATALGVSPSTSVADAIGANTGASPGVDLTGAGIDTVSTSDDSTILGMDSTTLITLALAGVAVLYFS